MSKDNDDTKNEEEQKQENQGRGDTHNGPTFPTKGS